MARRRHDDHDVLAARWAALAQDLGVPDAPGPDTERDARQTDRSAEQPPPLVLVPPLPPAGAETVPLGWWVEHTRPRPTGDVVTGAHGVSAHPAAPGTAGATAEPPVLPEPSALPVVGRHAARRRAFGPAHLGVVLAVVCAAALFTLWIVGRASPVPADPPVSVVAATVAPAADTAADTAESAPESADGTVPSDPSVSVLPAPAPEAEVTVHVVGKVRRPGLVVLPEGSRVADALEAAGGARPGVDLGDLNLARPLVDGEQVRVGLAGSPLPPAAPVPTAPSTSGPPTVPVDLNTADQVLLESLPQVGPVTAAAIIAWREEHGGFSAVVELLEVDGIGDATLAQLTPFVTV